jgi:pimeloyl-ACP methyl ester carboxylesterase
MLTWPEPSLLSLGAIAGAWLTFAGLAQLGSAFLRRPRTYATEGSAPVVARRPPPLRMLGTLTSLALALLVLGAGLLLQGFGADVAPDAFYDRPDAVPPTPGELVRLEGLASGLPAGARAWRILYTTTNADGSPALASGTVIAPARPASGPRPVLAVAHGTTGIASRCAPSLSKRPFDGGAGTALQRMVGAGWVGVMTDYVGLGTRGPHAYLVGESEARAVLDAVRAARGIPTLTLDKRTAVWGHSQGGHGALWTGIVAPHYAPELRIIGVAAMAPASDLLELAQGTKETTAGKMVLAYLAGSWASIYPGLDLARLVTPGYVAAVARLDKLCFEGPDAMAAAALSRELLDSIFREDAFAGRFGALLKANSPTGAIAAPVLIAQGDADRLVPQASQARFVASRCAAGQVLEYRVYPGLDHLPLVEPASPLTAELVTWTRARLAGEAAKSSC